MTTPRQELEMLRAAQAKPQAMTPRQELEALRRSAVEKPPEQPIAAVPQAEEPGVMDEIGRQIGLTGRAAIEGVTALPSLLAEPIRLGLNLIPGVNFAPQQQVVSGLLTEAGVPVAEHPTEKIVGKAAEFVAGAGGMIRAGQSLTEVAPTFAKFLTEHPGIQASVAVGSGLAGGITEEAGADKSFQVASELGGGLLAGMSVPAFLRTASKLYSSAVTKSDPILFQAEKETILEGLKKDNLTIDDAIKKLSDIGPEAMISDLGYNTARIAKDLKAEPGLAGQLIRESFKSRHEGQNERVIDVLRNSMGRPEDFFKTADDINLTRSIEAADMYSSIRDVKIPVDRELLDILDRHSARQGWREAAKMASDAGENFPSNLKNPDAGVELYFSTKQTMPLWQLDYIKRGIDDVINKEGYTDIFGKFMSHKGQKALETKTALVNYMDKHAKGYKEARDIFAGHSANLRALKLGRGFGKQEAEVTANDLKSMSDSELEMFRLGASREIAEKIRSAPDSADAYNKIMGSEGMREKLRVVFPTNRSFNEFSRLMKSEKAMFETMKDVMGGAKAKKPETEGVRGFEASVSKQGVLNAVGRKGLKMLSEKGVSSELNDRLAGMLVSRDQESNVRTLRSLEEVAKTLPKDQGDKFMKMVFEAYMTQMHNMAAQGVNNEPVQ